MRRAARNLLSLLAALLLVAGVLAVVAFVARLAAGDVTARTASAALIGAVAVVGVMRAVPGPRLLGGYSAIVYAMLFFPILVVVVYAFNSGRQVEIWEGFSTRWFERALNDEAITSSIERSLQIATASAIVATVLGTAAALALARARPRVRAPFDVLAFLTLVVPELVIAIAALIFFVNAGFELGLVTMFLGHTVFNASLVMLIVRSRFVSMGATLEEASADLGAGPLATFRQVTFPRLFPAVIAGGLLAFTFSFDDVIISQFTSGAGNQTWPLRVLNALKFGIAPDVNATAAMMLGVTLVGLGTAGLVLRISAKRQGVEVGTMGLTAPAAEPVAVPVPASEPAGPRPVGP